jgi:zinc/manganese transport system permease protein
MHLPSLMFWPLLAGLVLAGMHTWLGLQLVERRVVFAGLSFPQLAALGAALAFLKGHDVPSTAAYLWSVGFTLLGAAILTFIHEHPRTGISQESLIAMVYASSAGIAITVVSRMPQNTEHLEDMLVGNILSVGAAPVIGTAVLYALLALLYFVFRRKFVTASEAVQTPAGKIWDFLFYASFGVVVTLSVNLAGLLLVFAYLVFPAVAAMLFTRSTAKRLAIGWMTGALATAAGVLLSIEADIPTSAAIVSSFAGLLLLLALGRLGITRSTRQAHPR